MRSCDSGIGQRWSGGERRGAQGEALFANGASRPADQSRGGVAVLATEVAVGQVVVVGVGGTGAGAPGKGERLGVAATTDPEAWSHHDRDLLGGGPVTTAEAVTGRAAVSVDPVDKA